MPLVSKNTLKNWFVTLAKPTQAQFWAWMDSYWHKDESIPTSKITGLDDLFAGVATTEALEAKANTDASNISTTDREAWRTKLGVGDLPPDLVHTADLADYYTITQTDTLLSEKLDYPAAEIDSSIIPTQVVGLDSHGNSVQINPNYFASTGDLEDGLNTKIDKPTTTLPAPSATYKYVPLLDSQGNSTQMLAGDLGKNIANTNLTQVDAERTYNINGGNLTFSNGAVKSANLIVTGGSVNATPIGTTTPSTGRFTTLQTTGAGTFAGANTFSNASQKFSGLTNKITDSTYNRLLGMDSNGNTNEVGLYAMTNEMSQATDAMKDAWRIASRKTGETYSTGQPRIDIILPPIVDSRIEYIQYVTLVGLNLFINNTNPSTASVSIQRYKDLNGNTVSNDSIAIENIQVFQSNASILSFGINYLDFPTGYYRVTVIHNGLINLGTSDLLISGVINNIPIVLDNWQIYAPVNPTHLMVSSSSIKKVYDNTLRGSSSLEQQVKHMIINSEDVLSGFRLSFVYKLTTTGTNEPGNVKNRQKCVFGLGYNKNVEGTIVPDISITIYNLLLIGTKSITIPSIDQDYIYEIDIIVKNGLTTIIVNLTNTGLISTTTYSFEQKNENMYFYFTSYGSFNWGNPSQISGVSQEIFFPSSYQSF